MKYFTKKSFALAILNALLVCIFCLQPYLTQAQTYTPPAGPAATTCSTISQMATPVYVNGNSQGGGTSGSTTGFVWFNNTNMGEATPAQRQLPASAVGAVWGVAYKSQNKMLYTSSFLKRHVGLGPNGTGAIYQIPANTATPTASLFVDLTSLGVVTGADTRVVGDANNTLPNAVGSPSQDVNAFDAVGKRSLGGLDVSTDGTRMYVMNLNARELVALNISGASPTLVGKYAVPNPGCTNGVFRPWAVKCHAGKVFIGGVCSAENAGGVAANLRAYIYEFNPATNIYTEVYNFPLNYTRGQGGISGGIGTSANWKPWTSTWQTIHPDPTVIIYPQPVLSDIEFDMNGEIILGFLDRNGHQTGNANYKAINGNTTPCSGQTSGDILRIGIIAGAYQLENNGSASGAVAQAPNCWSGAPISGVGNNQGPGGGEYYWTDTYSLNPCTSADGGIHQELGFGGLAFIPGSGEVAMTCMDPTNTTYSGGVSWYSNTTGKRTHLASNQYDATQHGYRLYDNTTPGTFGKAGGLGDLESFCLPSVSLGNYVWNDTNSDGIQNEPASAGINGVTVKLYQETSPGVYTNTQTTTTANNASGNPGYYNFNITAEGNYYVQFPIQAGSGLVTIFSWNTNDDTDSNAWGGDGTSSIFYMSPYTGSDDFTIDAGYSTCLTIKNVAIGACSEVGGQPKARLDFTAIAPAAPSFTWGSVLIVKTAGQTYTIPHSNATSYDCSFLIPANGQNDTITAYFLPVPSNCNNVVKIAYTAPVSCVAAPCGTAGTLGGIVYKDPDANGIQSAAQQGLGAGLSGVTVTVFGNAGQVATTTTDANGKYNFTGLSNATKYRIEFSNYPAGWKPSQNGTNNGTNVQFATTPSCNVNFALLIPSEYCQDNPNVVIPMYVNGNPSSSVAGYSGNLGMMWSFPYNARDTVNQLSPNFGARDRKTVFADSLARGFQIGATWGVAYDRNKQNLYASSVLRRHAGFGPQGTGGIYRINLSTGTPTVTNWLNLDALGFPTGNTIIGNSVRALPTIPGAPNKDSLAFYGIGKYSLGGLEISEDNSKLFTLNLYDRKLYIINIPASGASPTATNVTSFAVPQTGCTATNGSFRPWAVKYYRGKVYIGGVCSGETQAKQIGYQDMTGIIYSFDPANTAAGFTQVYSFPLNYRWAFTNWNNEFGEWWENSAMFTDIEFDADGSIIVGLLNRSAYQFGLSNYTPDGSSLTSGAAVGDILRINNNNGTYTMENDGVSGSLIGTGTGNMEPTSNGRGFYRQSAPLEGNAQGGTAVWYPATQGALALKPGSGEVMTTFGDIMNFDSGGVGTLSTTNGQAKRGYEIFYSEYGFGKMGKAAGLGDIELLCNAAPVEIGNYVWVDSDADGIQDPSESPIPNVQIRLYSRTGTLVGVTTTNTQGEYYFNTSNVDTTGVSVTGVPTTGLTGMSLNTRYYVVIGKDGSFTTTNNVLTIATNKYVLTNANTGQGALPDNNDSDASLASGINAAFNGFPYINIVTGNAGESNHTFDFGFTNGTIGNYVWHDLNANGLQDDGAARGINTVTVELWKETSPSSGVYTLSQSIPTANDASGNAGYYLFKITESANYKVKFPTSSLGRVLTTQTATAATDNNSDANITDGFSPVFAMNVLGTGVAKDNLTIDAGYRCNTPNCGTVIFIKN